MIHEITKGIAEALYHRFQGVAIYSEQMKQGFCEPCFFVQSLRAEQKARLGNLFQQIYLFDIHYFPPVNGKENEAINHTAMHLYDALEYISYEQWKWKGCKMHHEKVDDVLHFFIEYMAYGCREKEKIPNMKRLKVDGEVK